MVNFYKFGKELGLIGSSSNCSLPPEPKPSSACKSHILYARAKVSSEIQNYFEPEPSQARILTLSPSRAEPAQLKLYGSSQLELKPDQVHSVSLS